MLLCKMRHGSPPGRASRSVHGVQRHAVAFAVDELRDIADIVGQLVRSMVSSPPAATTRSSTAWIDGPASR
jgi:hypothetical protein